MKSDTVFFGQKFKFYFIRKQKFCSRSVMIISMCFRCNCIFSNVKKRQLRSTVPYLEVVIVVVIVW